MFGCYCQMLLVCMLKIFVDLSNPVSCLMQISLHIISWTLHLPLSFPTGNGTSCGCERLPVCVCVCVCMCVFVGVGVSFCKQERGGMERGKNAP